MQTAHSSTVEDYLKAVFTLSEAEAEAAPQPVALGKIAEQLDVTPGTVTTMMKGLAERGLVKYQSRQGVRLTPAGREAATTVLRRHRLVELFLVEVLELDWAFVHEEAEVLEHAVSDRLLERIDDMLDHPEHDPHGAPIPSLHGEFPEQASLVLSECPTGRYRVVRVSSEDPDFLSWVEHQDLRPGRELVVVQRDMQADTFTITSVTGDHRQTIGSAAAARIQVAPVPTAES